MFARSHGKPANALWTVVASPCVVAIGYRFHSAWMLAKVLTLDHLLATPAQIHGDGGAFVETNQWVVFGHHFAAIAGPGPLVGPVLAARFGWLPGMLRMLGGLPARAPPTDRIRFAPGAYARKSIASAPRPTHGGGVTRLNRIMLGAVLGAAAALGGWRFLRTPEPAPVAARPITAPAQPPAPGGQGNEIRTPHSVAAPVDTGDRARIVRGLIARIESDYDEIRAKAAADYAAAGKAFPGGLNAFLRQLALLEREKRADLAKELTPRELEDYELRATNAGKQVDRLLGGTVATDAQRRAAFRHQLEFEDRFALVFDLSPSALAERETARHATQEKIRGVLGDELFAGWLRGEGAEFEEMLGLVIRQGQPLGAALELWTVRNAFTRGRLAILADKHLGAEQRRAALARLAEQTEIRVASIVGLGGLQAGRDEGLKWLQPN